MSLDVSLSDNFTETEFFKINSCILKEEDALLDLGPSSVFDGVLYC